MQQSLYAFMAIVLLSLLMLSQIRTSLHQRQKAYDRQLEGISTDIANDYLERQIELLQFDEGLTVGGIDPVVLVNPPTAMLSSNANLGSDTGEAIASYDDIDDWHLKSDSGAYISHGNTFEYEVSFNVSYVNPSNGDSTSTRTLAKKVEARVMLAEYQVPITISRIYTPSQLFMKEVAIAEATASPGPASAGSPTTPPAAPAPNPDPPGGGDDDGDDDDSTTTTTTDDADDGGDDDDDSPTTTTPPQTTETDW